MARPLPLSSLFVLALACGEPPGAADAGRDASPDAAIDAGSDGAVSDAGPPDAGPPDPCLPEVVEAWDLGAGRWSTSFSAPGIVGYSVDEVVWRDGTLYVGGGFEWAGPIAARNVAAWSASTGWRALGAGLVERVVALAVAEDGAVYAAGRSAEGWSVHRFADDAWARIGVADREIAELAVRADGVLLAGGWMTSIDGVDAPRLAAWDGSVWSPVDHIGVSSVDALRADEDEVCIGGRLVSRAYVACLSTGDTVWREFHELPVQPGPPYPTPIQDLVRTSAGELIAVGAVVLDGDRDAGGVVRWVGGEPELLGRGFSGASAVELLAIDEASDGALWVAGDFSRIGPGPTTSLADYAFGVARWSGDRWVSVGGVEGFPGSQTLAAGAGGVFVGGVFDRAFTSFGSTGVAALNVARWTGAGWSALAHPGVVARGPGRVTALAARGACGPYVSGSFDAVGDRVLPYAGVLGDDDQLRQMSPTAYLDTVPSTLAVAPDGTVYAAGIHEVHSAGETREPSALARWSGREWEPFGPLTERAHRIFAMAVDPRGWLYIGGSFEDPDDPSRSHLLRWRHGGWTPVGEREPRTVSAIVVMDGDVVVAEAADGGRSRVARFRDEAWTVLGEPLGGGVSTLIEHGGELFAAGRALTATSLVARWNGTAWEAVGELGGSVSATPRVAELAVLGDALIAVGSFALDASSAEDVNAAYLADGRWVALGSGVDGPVHSIAVTPRGLLLGGDFASAGGVASWGLARFEPAE